MTVSDIHIDPARSRPAFRPLKAWNHMQRLLADKEDTEQVFHIIEALNGRSLERNFRAFSATPGGQAALRARADLPSRLDQHDWIRALPEGTVGRAYVDFMEREGLTAQGLVDESRKMRRHLPDYRDDLAWFGDRLRDTHDLFHVLSGYGRDALGEASLLAFSHGQNPGPGVIFIAFIGSRQIAKAVPEEAGVMACFREGLRNGRAAAKIAEQDIFALLEEPLGSARDRLRIAEPAAYRRALQVCAAAGVPRKDIRPVAA